MRRIITFLQDAHWSHRVHSEVHGKDVVRPTTTIPQLPGAPKGALNEPRLSELSSQATTKKKKKGRSKQLRVNCLLLRREIFGRSLTPEGKKKK